MGKRNSVASGSLSAQGPVARQVCDRADSDAQDNCSLSPLTGKCSSHHSRCWKVMQFPAVGMIILT